jgi:hypothetical protein
MIGPPTGNEKVAGTFSVSECLRACHAALGGKTLGGLADGA